MLNIIILEVLCIVLTNISLYLSTGTLGERMYKSYFENNWIIFLNFLPIFYVAIVSYVLIRRTSIAFGITALISYTITLVNYFKMQLRNDNLLIEDITLIKEALAIKTNYTFQFTPSIITFIIMAIVITAILYIFIDKEKGKKIVITKKNIISRIAGTICLLVLGVVCLEKIYINPTYYLKTKNDEGGYFSIWSAVNQYISRGTIYSFLNSYQGVKKFVPEGYNKKNAEKKLYSYKYSNIDENKKVNVIGIMLEAYNDFSKFDEIDFNVDIYEKFHEIEAESYSGELVTNIFAGGTVDTERRFLTGYTNMQSFRKPTNSYARYFKEQGYKIEGSHPCYEWFYNRVNVNKNLGFENYYFFEDKYSDLANGGLAQDSILMPEILNLYNKHKETSNQPYFSFNVTYQGHGPYPLEKLFDTEYVKRKEGYTEAEYNILNNYFHSVEDTNENLYNLVQELKKDDEPVVLIVFGDHNPWLGNDNSVYNMLGISLRLDEEIGCYNYYCTPYFIWANDKAKEVLENDFQGDGEKISPSFLMNKFFELAGYEGNEYMKASNELMKDITVINNNFYIQNGEFTHSLSNENAEKLNEFYKMQYYWLNEYRKRF